MADQTSLARLAIPGTAIQDGNRADRAVGGVRGRNMCAVGRPGAATKVCGEGRGEKRGGDCVLKDEVVDLVLLRCIWWWGIEPIDFDGAVVACSCEVLVRRIECNSLDMTLVVRQRFQLFE